MVNEKIKKSQLTRAPRVDVKSMDPESLKAHRKAIKSKSYLKRKAEKEALEVGTSSTPKITSKPL